MAPTTNLGAHAATKLMLEKLKESGLTKCVKALGFQALTKEETEKLGHEKRESIKIPYWTLEGKPSGFYRLRYTGEPKGFQASAEKEHRYVQPPNTLPEVYLCPLVKWEMVFHDPTIPLYLTEGEFKAGRGCLAGLPVIGLGGVEMWRAARKGHPDLLPLLTKINWQNRPVALIWDSDAADKPDVLRAQRQLAEELCSRGALPTLVVLPPSKEGKVGLDDYLEAESLDALKTLINDTPPWEASQHLYRMNDEVAFVKAPPSFLLRKTGKLYNEGDFRLLYMDRKFKVVEGDKVKTKYVWSEWREWKQRSTVPELTFAPGEEQITSTGAWNLWKGYGCESKKGDIKPWDWLLDHIFKEKRAERRWFEQWCAYPFQHPGGKLLSAPIVWGVKQGTGKTLLGLTVADLYGQHGGSITEAELHSDFNGWIRNKQFLVGDEITGNDRRDVANRLKDMITGERLQINEKYEPKFELPNCVNFYLTSNAPNALYLEKYDRRWFVHEVLGGPATQGEYRTFDRWRKGGGLPGLRYHLEHVDLSGFSPDGAPPMTQAKLDMIEDNKSEVAAWAMQLKDDPDHVLLGLPNAKAATECDLFTTKQLFTLLSPGGPQPKLHYNALSRELKASGFLKAYNGVPVKTPAGTQKLWIVRNEEQWEDAKHDEVAKHWASFWCTGSKY